MTSLKPQQKRVLNTIKVFQAEYQEGVPYNILKLDLNIPEDDLSLILHKLEEEEYISWQDGIIRLKTNGKKNERDEKGETVLQENLPKETTSETADSHVDNNFPKSSIGDKTDERDVLVGKAEKTEENVNNGKNEDNEYNEFNEDLGDAGGDEVKEELSETEQQSLEIISKLVDESGNISRTLLEGTLLYGDLRLSNIRMYNLIISLEYKGFLKKITLTDGEYYHFTP
ncbi:MAG: hypothetical protein HVN35_01040 [Methanobacteriaceae archaeon]|nr:hypothetical protein [Methanobacteriaceae archaeon]